MIRPLVIVHNTDMYHLLIKYYVVNYWDNGVPGSDENRCFEYIVGRRCWAFKSFKSHTFGGRHGTLQALLDAGCPQ